MTTLTPAEIYVVAVDAGFSPDQAVTFTAIALAESRGVTEANAAGSEDSRGLWQINVSPGVRDNTWGDLYDPRINARAAYEVSDGGTNIDPWSVTHDNNAGTPQDYRSYLDEAAAGQQASGNMSVEDVGGTIQVESASTNGLVGQPLSDATLTDTWGDARDNGRTHEGIDIFADEGTPIHAIVGGTVVTGFWNDIGGVVVRIEGDDGRYYYYAHVLEGSTDHLTVGQRVEAGDQIAEVSNTGNASESSPHLHLGIREDGVWVNPYDLLQDVPDFEDIPAVAAGQQVEDPFAIDAGSLPTDADLDGLTDDFEKLIGTDVHAVDTDHDGLSDRDETSKYHSDPLIADTDGDGIADMDEIIVHSDVGLAPLPTVALQAGFGGGRTLYSDADGLSDLYEIEHGTDPFNVDTDGDLLNDDLEFAIDSNPLNIDTNGDGLTDSIEDAASPSGVDDYDTSLGTTPFDDSTIAGDLSPLDPTATSVTHDLTTH